jgi:hypothetical protein
MIIEYSFTSKELKAVWNAFRGYNTISIANAHVWYIAAPSISLLLLLLGAYSEIIWLQEQGRVLLFSSLVSIPIHFVFNKWKFNTWLKNNFSLILENERYSISANDEGLVVAKRDSVESRVDWTAIKKVVQNEVITIMYLSRDACFYFPTKSMNPSQRAELNDLIACHVTRKKP